MVEALNVFFALQHLLAGHLTDAVTCIVLASLYRNFTRIAGSQTGSGTARDYAPRSTAHDGPPAVPAPPKHQALIQTPTGPH